MIMLFYLNFRIQQRLDFNFNQSNEDAIKLTPKEIKELPENMIKAGFNIALSDKTSLKRSLKDMRSMECQAALYPAHKLTASVVIIFYNEAWSMVLRTVHSVVNRSPPGMLKEVILVDDASTNCEYPV